MTKKSVPALKSLACCTPRQSVLDGSEDFVVNLSTLPELTEKEAMEFLDANVLTSGMEELIIQVVDRLNGGPSRGIFKLSEAMGGGKTQSMLVTGILCKFPKLMSSLPFKKTQKVCHPDHVIAFTGRSTDQNIWVTLGKQLGADFQHDSAPSEKQWSTVFQNKSVLILLDEVAFYLVHAVSQGTKEQGERFSTLTALALTNLFGAIRDHKDAGRVAVVVADLQKDWEQGHEDLARIMESNVTLGGTIQSANNELSKGAVSISPVDNTKDELYAILRKRLFKEIDIQPKEKKDLIDAYFAELQTAKKAGLVERALATIRDELEVSYPFHFSTKHLIETFNDNPGFQKTRDVIRLMASIVRSIWGKGEHEVQQHTLLSLASPDLNVSAVSSRFKEIKRSLEGALQTDVANSGTSYAESLVDETDGLSLIAAKWIYVSSLSEARPRGLSKEEIAEYIASPGVDLSGLSFALDELYRNCWYIDQLRSGRYFFNKVKNLNAQLNSYVKHCTDPDRDSVIDTRLTEMFEPKEKRCYQRLLVHPDFTKIALDRDKTTLVICGHDAPFKKFFEGEKYKNRIAILTLVDAAGLVRIRSHARRQWAIELVMKDMNKEDAQYEKAKEERTKIQSELFLALRSIYARLLYPLGDPSTGESKLTETILLDSYTEEVGGPAIKYDGKDNSTKGELVIESTLRSVAKYQVISSSAGADKVKPYQSLRTRVEQFLFPPAGRASWDQLLDGAASRGIMVWFEPGRLERMKEILLTAGEWRDEAGQFLKPPFEEVTAVSIDHERDSKTGRITTTDIKLFHADTLVVSEDGRPPKKIKYDEAFSSDGMTLVFEGLDSTGKNKTGKPYRITNYIEIKYDFLPTTKAGFKTLKIGVVPADAKLKWSGDGGDPANNGISYTGDGVEVQEGTSVKIYAEKSSISNEASFIVPTPSGNSKDGNEAFLDPDMPTTVAGKVLRELGLVSRKSVHDFLSKLPSDCLIVGPRAKIVKAESDNRVAVSWDGKTYLTCERLLHAYEFLDQELPEAEWELDATSIVFSSGRQLIEWQKKCSVKIASGLMTQ